MQIAYPFDFQKSHNDDIATQLETVASVDTSSVGTFVVDFKVHDTVGMPYTDSFEQKYL